MKGLYFVKATSKINKKVNDSKKKNKQHHTKIIKKKSVSAQRNNQVDKKINSKGSVYRDIQKSLDSALLILPPKVQANIDLALKSLERSAFRLQDLRSIGYRVLQHATEISNTLKETTSISKLRKKTKGK